MEKPSEKPESSTASSAANTIQPELAATSITALISALTAPPARDRDKAPNPCADSRESSTTTSSWSTIPGAATRTGGAPSRAAKTAAAVKASRVTAAGTPTRVAASSPVASRRGGSGSSAKCSGRSTGAPP